MKGGLQTRFSGIGRAIAQYLISSSHNVVLVARSEGPLEELRTQSPQQVRTLAGDTSDASLPGKVVEYTLKEFGSLDALIVNHGTLDPVGSIANNDITAWKKTFDVNFFSAVSFVSSNFEVFLEANSRSLGRSCFTHASQDSRTHSFHLLWSRRQCLPRVGRLWSVKSGNEPSGIDFGSRGA